jgi:hypothetical protein
MWFAAVRRIAVILFTVQFQKSCPTARRESMYQRVWVPTVSASFRAGHPYFEESLVYTYDVMDHSVPDSFVV